MEIVLDYIRDIEFNSKKYKLSDFYFQPDNSFYNSGSTILVLKRNSIIKKKIKLEENWDELKDFFNERLIGKRFYDGTVFNNILEIESFRKSNPVQTILNSERGYTYPVLMHKILSKKLYFE